MINVLVSEPTEKGVTYNTRMFAPTRGVLEDQVCGSANCLSAPYWQKKKNLAPGTEMVVKSVSKRSGYLWVTVDDEKKKLVMSGEVKEVARGTLTI